MESLENKVERLQRWVNDLQSGMYINCVYCGHRYGPDPGTPVAMSEVLKKHIEQCPEHPLHAMKVRCEKAEKLLELKGKGIKLIAKERIRQIEEKSWTPAHDDEHTDGALRVVAAMCACDGTDAKVIDPLDRDFGIIKRHGYLGKEPDEIHLLSVAGALIAAEIDRLLRFKKEDV